MNIGDACRNSAQANGDHQASAAPRNPWTKGATKFSPKLASPQLCDTEECDCSEAHESANKHDVPCVFR